MTTNDKPKFAMYWASSCGGCEISVLNIHEKLLEVDANFEVVFWPVAMDAKIKDVEAMPDQSITLTLFNGGMRTTENVEMAYLLRRKSQILVAFGSCACEGCLPGLLNLSSVQSTLDYVYSESSYRRKSSKHPSSTELECTGRPASSPGSVPATEDTRPGCPGRLSYTGLPTRIETDCRCHRSCHPDTARSGYLARPRSNHRGRSINSL
jgi:coenzyme F420-reducing hydrogenase gamma subunit